jgi:hypothetical protein
MNEFHVDDAWQRGVRDKVLAPGFYGEYAVEGRYVFIDRGRLAGLLQKRYAVDTIVQGRDGKAACIEEKIVRWPYDRKTGKPKDRPHTRFFLETESCTVPGHESNGWMVYGQADYLNYCFASRDESALTCWLIDFPELQTWFWEHVEEFRAHQMTDTVNRTCGRLVPIEAVRQNVKCWCREIRAIEAAA